MFKQNYLIGLLFLAFGSSFVASAEDTLQLDASLAAEETASSMTWPMLPGESVNDVARLFYPKNSAMQQQFVAKTLRLNTETQTNLKANSRFEAPTLLVVPTLKSLSKNAAKADIKANKKSLKISYGLKRVIQLAPEKLLQEYEELVTKNAFLKQQLVNLNEKIAFLETKLGELKLIFDKTLTLPQNGVPVVNQTTSAPLNVPFVDNTSAASQPAASQPTAKKVYKNLNKTPSALEPEPLQEASFTDSLNMDLAKAVFACVVLLLVGAFALKKYRERMLANLSFANNNMQNTATDFSGYFEKTKLAVDLAGPETIQQQHAAKAVEVRLSATLEEAKLLMSVNRGTDAIAHLKMTIESQPKASINHWLYLLEVFRKLNLKDEFEEYANQMHTTFNVMTPVWYDKKVAIVIPQSLEEFPHIIEQLCGVWPGELASVYLRSLITDNRGGERVGFGKEVVGEILFLIELLDSHKDIAH